MTTTPPDPMRVAEAEARLLVLKEHLRREREYRHPVNRFGRFLGGVARSIATGGWE